MTLVEMVRALWKGCLWSFQAELATRAFHSSDFPAILADVASKTLLDTYERLIARQNFQPWFELSRLRL